MKRIIALLLILSTLFVFSGCGEVSDKSNITYEIALLTDSSGLSKSNSINSEVWNGLVEAAVANKKSYRQYTAERNTAKAYRSIANKAIKNNAKLIVLVGEAFAEILPDLQTNNENVTFLWIDGHNLDEIRDNTYIVSYDKVQLGFLAGYAAVKDGNKFLGFQGVDKSADSNQYCAGFMLGADYAAQEMELNKDEVSILYRFSDSKTANSKTENSAISWYNSGTEIIFACEGDIYESVINAAETCEEKYLITEGTDKIHFATHVISSAVKNYKKSAYIGVNTYCENKLSGGKLILKDFNSDEINLSNNFSKWKTLESENIAGLKGKINVNANTVDSNISKLPLSLVQIRESK